MHGHVLGPRLENILKHVGLWTPRSAMQNSKNNAVAWVGTHKQHLCRGQEIVLDGYDFNRVKKTSVCGVKANWENTQPAKP